MPPMESSNLPHRLVYWAKGAVNEFDEATVSAPVEIRARWSFGRADALDAQGNKIGVDATAVLNRDVAIGDQLWKAPLNDTDALEQWYGTGSGGSDDEVMVVVNFDRVEDLKGRNVSRVAMLKKFKDTHG